MHATILHSPRDVRLVEREDPKILAPTDAILYLPARISARAREATIELSPDGAA